MPMPDLACQGLATPPTRGRDRLERDRAEGGEPELSMVLLSSATIQCNSGKYLRSLLHNKLTVFAVMARMRWSFRLSYTERN